MALPVLRAIRRALAGGRTRRYSRGRGAGDPVPRGRRARTRCWSSRRLFGDARGCCGRAGSRRPGCCRTRFARRSRPAARGDPRAHRLRHRPPAAHCLPTLCHRRARTGHQLRDYDALSCDRAASSPISSRRALPVTAKGIGPRRTPRWKPRGSTRMSRWPFWRPARRSGGPSAGPRTLSERHWATCWRRADWRRAVVIGPGEEALGQ